MDNKEYKKIVFNASPKSPKIKDFIMAFLVGGLICAFGQILYELFLNLKIEDEISKILVPCTIIFIAALLTGFRVFEIIAKKAGAGTLVPITGFANAVVAPAIEFKNEGLILGIGVKIFTIAGPVILYGTLASILYGLIYFLLGE